MLPLRFRLAAVALTIALVTGLGACTAVDRVPATPTAAPTGSSGPGPTTSPVEPTGSVDTRATTLRTIAGATEKASQLTIGRELSSNDKYSSHAATYTSDGLTISAVLHEPLAPGPHPGVVLVHGFVDPATYTTGGELTREQDFLARAGYVVLYTDLRGLAESDPSPPCPPDLDMGATDDVISAISALRDSRLPSVDRDRIGLLGHSLGGLLVLNVLVTKPGLVGAVVAFAPSSIDPFQDVERYLAPGDPLYDALIAAHGTPTTNPGYWADISPRTFVDRVTAPLLIVHGDADADSPYASSVDTVAAWRAAGKDVELVTLTGEDHVFEAGWGKAMAAVSTFLARHLG